jgi:hypothetical protein
MERCIARKKNLPIFDVPAKWLGGILTLIAMVLFVVGAWKWLNRAVVGLDPDSTHLFSQQGWDREVRGGWLLAAGALMGALYVVPLMAGIAGCVARERQRQTLDSLLLTLIPRYRLLWSKVQAHIERSLGFGVASVAAIGCDFGALGGVKCGLVVMASVVAGFWFVTAYGAWLSVRCQTPGRAFWLCLLPISGAIGHPLLTWSLIDWPNTGPTTTALSWMAAVLAVLGCVAAWRAVAELNADFRGAKVGDTV